MTGKSRIVTALMVAAVFTSVLIAGVGSVSAAEGDLTVNVTDEDGNPVSDATVEVLDTSDYSTIGTNTTESDGQVTFTGLSNDTTVNVLPEHSEYHIEGATNVDLGDSTTEVNLTAEPLYDTDVYTDDDVSVAPGDEYNESFTQTNSSIQSVNVSQFSLSGDNLTDGETHTVSIEVLQERPEGVYPAAPADTMNVTVGETVNISSVVGAPVNTANASVVISTDSADAGFDAESVKVLGQTTDEPTQDDEDGVVVDDPDPDSDTNPALLGGLVVFVAALVALALWD